MLRSWQLSLLLVLGVSSYSVASTTIRVPQDYPSIPAAIAAANRDDSVVVSPGLYRPSLGLVLEADFDGVLTKTGPNTLTYFYSTPDQEPARFGALYRVVYSIRTNTWGRPIRCWNHPAYRYWSGGGGTVAGRVVFFRTLGANSRIGYIRSTDSQGTSFSDFVPVPLPYYLCSPFGRAFFVPDINTWYQPYYAYRQAGDTTTYVLGLLESNDQGETWHAGPIMYDGPFWFTEPSAVYIGNHRIVAFARNVPAGAMVQCVSANDGKSWTMRFRDDLGARHTCIPEVAFSQGQVLLAYHERFDIGSPSNRLVLRSGPADRVFSFDTSAFGEPLSVPQSDPGYPELCQIDPGRFYIMNANIIGNDWSRDHFVGGQISFPLSPSDFVPESVDFHGKAITVSSQNPNDPRVVASTIIDAGGFGPAVKFDNGETSEAVLKGFTVRGGHTDRGGGIYCGPGTRPIIRDSIITENTANAGGGIGCVDASPTLINTLLHHNVASAPDGTGDGGGIAGLGNSAPIIAATTIAYCRATGRGGGIYLDQLTASIRNSVIAFNEGGGVTGAGSWVNPPSYCDFFGNVGGESVDSGTGTGNLLADPLFADGAHGVFELKSCNRRWSPLLSRWVKDSVTSPCIDAGDPAITADQEPRPNGDRMNMGYGANTRYASVSSAMASHYPADASTAVSAATRIRIVFRTQVRAATAETRFSLAPTGGTAVSGVISWPKVGRVMEFQPDALLMGGSTYIATLRNGVREKQGRLLTWTETFSFTTSSGAQPSPAMTVTSARVTGHLVQFAVALSEKAYVQIDIQNLAGRNVASLPPATCVAGVSNIAWNGRTRHNTLAPAGPYLAYVRAFTAHGQTMKCLHRLIKQ
jgi:hypothetical protein